PIRFQFLSRMSRSSLSQFPSRQTRGGRAFSSREAFSSRRENGLDSDIVDQFRRGLNSPCFDIPAAF
ncbi:MAG: hypothetical protein Q7U92_25955, partial [Bradyrhizobium sp.]|nr:hypothetical protein [Bradyrhizobium sp.]